MLWYFQASWCYIQPTASKGFSRTAHDFCTSAYYGERNTGPFYYTQGTCGVLNYCWSGTSETLMRYWWDDLLWTSLLNLSLFQDFCCRNNPAVVKSRPCSDDSHKGWIQDWDILHQTWECKGFWAFFICVLNLS